jgi:two-component system, cell cycle response regulator DivK
MPRILLVEDNEMNRDMLSRRLARREYEVLVAVDGKEGVVMAGSEGPDLILMDMSLPVMDGWEATRQLKASPETKAIPIIALTAHAIHQIGGEWQQKAKGHPWLGSRWFCAAQARMLDALTLV